MVRLNQMAAMLAIASMGIVLSPETYAGQNEPSPEPRPIRKATKRESYTSPRPLTKRQRRRLRGKGD